MARVAFFFVLDQASLPENFGMKLSVESLVPFHDSIQRDSSLTKLVYSDSTAYCLRLFKKPYNTDILIVVKDLDYHTGGNLREVCRVQAAKILEHKDDKPFFHEEYQYRAMWLPRGLQRQEFTTMVRSFSGDNELDPETLPRLDSRSGWIMQHADGFIFGTKNEDDFLRGLLFYSVQLAYHFHINRAVNRLSVAASTRGDQIPGIVQEMHRFYAQYYFSNPVKPMHRLDRAEFEHITAPLDLDSLRQELDRKIQHAAAMVSPFSRSSEPEGFSAGEAPVKVGYAPQEPSPSSFVKSAGLVVAGVVFGVALLLGVGGVEGIKQLLGG